MSAIKSTEIRAAFDKADSRSPAYNMVLAMMRADEQGAWSADLLNGEKLEAISRITAYIQTKGKMGSDIASKLAGDVWEGMNAGDRRTLIEQRNAPGMQVEAIISAAVMKNEAVANRINPEGAKDANAVLLGNGDSYFKLDPMLRNTQFDRSLGGAGIGGSGDRAANYAAALGGEIYDPKRGVSSLTERNFNTSPYYGSGLSASDIPTIKYLASQGFSVPQIVQAGADRKALGLSGQQSAENLAFIRKDSAEHIKRLKDYRRDSVADAADYAGTIKEAEKAEAEGRMEDARKAREKAQKIQQEQEVERDRLANQSKDPAVRKRIKQEADKVWRNNQDAAIAAVEAGVDPATIKAYSHDPHDAVAKANFEAAQKKLIASGDPAKIKAVEELVAAANSDEQLRAKVISDTKAVAAKIEENNSEVDSLLADINGGDDQQSDPKSDQAAFQPKAGIQPDGKKDLSDASEKMKKPSNEDPKMADVKKDEDKEKPNQVKLAMAKPSTSQVKI